MENTSSALKKSWFILKVLSGAETNVMNQIKLNYEAANLENYFEEIYCPSIEIKFGKKVKTKYLYPGYIFIKMVMNEKAKDAVISVPRIYSFLTDGMSGTPKRISDAEYEKMIGKITEVHKSGAEGMTFAIGQTIKIKSGSFNEFKGTVLAIDKEKKLLTLSILVFQRETTVTVAFEDAEKIEQ